MSAGTVLIVDDHDVLRSLLQSYLQERFTGLRILEATDGETAVRMATEARPSVVIMDIALPGMNGIDATRAIKDALPETTVVILTVHELAAYRNDAAAAGADAYIPKRHMQSKLGTALSAFLEPASAGPAQKDGS